MEHHLERFPPSDFYGSAELFAEMYPDGRPTIWALMDLTKTTSIADGTALSKELHAGAPAAGTAAAAATNQAEDAAREPHSPLAHEWPILLMMTLILLCGKVACGVNWATTGAAFALYFLMASVGNALHMSFHVRNFHLEKYDWYMELRTLHYIHHLGDMKSNFAMLNLGMDQLFHSLAVEDFDLAPKYNKSKSKASSGTSSHGLPVRREWQKRRGPARNHRVWGAPVGLPQLARGLRAGAGRAVDLESANKKRRHLQRGGRYVSAVLLRLIITALALNLWFSTFHASYYGEAAVLSPTAGMDGVQSGGGE